MVDLGPMKVGRSMCADPSNLPDRPIPSGDDRESLEFLREHFDLDETEAIALLGKALRFTKVLAL